MASCGTPAAPRSTCVCSVMVVPPLSRSGATPEAHPGHLPSLRVERENGEAAGRGGHRRRRELRDRSADDRDFRDVVPGAFPGRALPLTHPHVNAGDHDPVRAHPAHIALELDPGVMPGQVDQLGVAAHLGVPRAPEGRAAGPPVVVPSPDRDPQRQADRHPSGMDQLGEILAGQIGAERMRRGPRPYPPHRRAGGPGPPTPRPAVPRPLTSSPPSGNEPKLSLTPTIPCPPSAAHSAVIRPIAVRLASYIALVSGP